MNTAKLYRLITENKELILEPVYSELLGMVNEELAKEAEKQAESPLSEMQLSSLSTRAVSVLI